VLAKRERRLSPKLVNFQLSYQIAAALVAQIMRFFHRQFPDGFARCAARHRYGAQLPLWASRWGTIRREWRTLGLWWCWRAAVSPCLAAPFFGAVR